MNTKANATWKFEKGQLVNLYAVYWSKVLTIYISLCFTVDVL
jgi:hypothetical protein